MKEYENREMLETAPVNLILIAISAIVFAAGAMNIPGIPSRDWIYMRGALYAPLLLKGQGFYRILTAVFIHADTMHLFNNLIVQFAGGNLLEKKIGHVRYALVFLLSGIAGNLVSVAADFVTGSFGFSVGASGAVFGVLGAMIFLIVRQRDRSGRYRSLLLRTGLMTAYLLLSGWRNPSINQAAHAGGLAAGFVLCALMMHGRSEVDLEELLR